MCILKGLRHEVSGARDMVASKHSRTAYEVYKGASTASNVERRQRRGPSPTRHTTARVQRNTTRNKTQQTINGTWTRTDTDRGRQTQIDTHTDSHGQTQIDTWPEEQQPVHKSKKVGSSERPPAPCLPSDPRWMKILRASNL